MFQPVFVFDSHHASSCISEDFARSKEFRLVDIREVGSTVHGGNPPVIVYDGDGFIYDRVPNGRSRFAPPKCTGVMVMFGPNKGHVHGLADPKAFVEWFFGKSWNDWSHWNRLTGNFRLR